MAVLGRYLHLAGILLVFSMNANCTPLSNSTSIKSLCSKCECLGGMSSDTPYSVDCNGMNLLKIPEVNKDMKTPWKLQLQKNSISTVTRFSNLTNLRILSFKYNKITKIEEGAFEQLPNLKVLLLGHNNLTDRSLSPEMFRGPYNAKEPEPLPIKMLDLSANHIGGLPTKFFLHMRGLQTLDLSHNPFRDIGIKTAQAIAELHELQTLDLSYTQLTRIPDHFFSELRNLTELDLSGNNFITVPDEVNYIQKLRILRLNDNAFGVLYGHSFWKSLKHLDFLEMTGSKSLFRIENGAFGNLTALTKLHLKDNEQLSIIMPRAFLGDSNYTLHLQELLLQNNELHSLPEFALPWAKIPVLNLQDNPWNCDCKLEWLAKDVMRKMQDSSNYELSLEVLCAAPPELLGERLTSDKVQKHKFVCTAREGHLSGGYGFLVVATIVVGILLLVTGTIVFSYILFKRTKVQDWLGNNVKYRRTFNDDEEVITSATPQY